MSKVTPIPVTSVFNTLAINENNRKFAEALNEGVLWRKNPEGEPNDMKNDIDMNSKRIYNLPEPVLDHEAARKVDMETTKAYAEELLNKTEDAKDKAEKARDEAIKAESSAKNSADKAEKEAQLGISFLEAASKGQFRYFRTKAEAVSATIPDDYFVQVFVDETRGDRNVIYKKEVGDLVFQVNLDALRDDLSDSDKGANLIAFKYVATGSVEKSLFEKIKDQRINVKDFGAIGDGVSDDTTAIQNAINAASTGTGCREIFFPEGSYGISSRLSLRSNVKISANKDATIFPLDTFPGASANMMYAGTRSYVEFIGMGFDLKGRLDIGVCWLENCSNVKFSECKFLSVQKIGELVSNRRSGVRITGTSDNIFIEKNIFEGVYNAVWALGTGKNIFIRDNRISGLGNFGILFSEANVFWTTIRIENNIIDGYGSGRSLIYIGALAGNSALTGYHNDVVIANNYGIGSDLPYVNSPSFPGNGDLFSLRAMENARVHGNYAINGGDLGIVIEHSRNVAVSDNIATGNEISGIVLHKAENCTVTGNVCYNNCVNRADNATITSERAGIRVMAGSREIILTGNRCYDSREAGKTQLWGIFVTTQGESGAGQSGRGIHIGLNHLSGNKLGGINYTSGMNPLPYLEFELTGGSNTPNSMWPRNTVFRHTNPSTGLPFISVVNNTAVRTASNGAQGGSTSIVLNDIAGLSPQSKLAIQTNSGDVVFHGVESVETASRTVHLTSPIGSSGVSQGTPVFVTNWRVAVKYSDPS